MRQTTTLAMCALVLLPVTSAHAQRDHLQCFRARDPISVKGILDVDAILALQPGCKIGKAKLVCNPAAVSVLTSNVPTQPVSGRGLLDSRICYRLSCPKPYPGPLNLTDRFGTHTLEKPRPKLICTSAVKGPPATAQDDIDRIECYKAKDAIALKGTVVSDTLDLGLYNGCRIGKAKLFCVGAHTTLQSINVDPLLPIGGTGLDDNRLCYGVSCPKPYPGPQIVSDEFGSRTLTGLVPKMLCTPSPVIATTTTTVTTTTVTTTTFPPGTDQALVCQRAIETGGMAYAHELLDRVEGCTEPGGDTNLTSCLASAGVITALNAKRNQWSTVVSGQCGGVDPRTDLGYPETCGAAPSICTFPSPVVDAGGISNDVLDCLACRIKEQLSDTAIHLYANADPVGTCAATLGNGALGVLRTTLVDTQLCVQHSGQISVASCYTPDPGGWRGSAETACTGVNVYGLGYQQTCSRHQGPVFPGACPANAFPCAMSNSLLTEPNNPDNDLLDCLTCQLGEGVLGVARDLFGTNLCCIGGACNKVLTRFACREAGGVPQRYRMSSMPGVATSGAHGIEIGPDGFLYMTGGPGGVVTKAPLAGGSQTAVGPLNGFGTGVAIDPAGNVYVTYRCGHRIEKITNGVATIFAGTGTAGHSGDGGPATAAQIKAPDGITLDAAGNVFFTESSALAISCGAFGGTGSESIRMVDTSGNMHTIAGLNTTLALGEGGPALTARFVVPYGLRRAYDGTLLIGEAGGQRALRIDANGILTRVAGEFISVIGNHAGYGGPAVKARFYQNCGLSDDQDGNVVIGPMEDNRIALVDTLGSVIAIAGTGQGSVAGQPSGDGLPGLQAQAGCPEDTLVGPDGRVYFSDLFTQRIRVLTREPY